MLEVKIDATKNGVQLAMHPPGREPFVWSVPLQGATYFWMDWWRALSTHYPDVALEPDDKELPTIIVTGDFRMKTAAQSNALVRLVLQPRELVGLGFEFQPHEAREVARQLNDMADQAEAFQSPN
ncbi:MAG TPA: hypothetical protein VIL84_02655 [Devosiaceae bacterium]